MICFANIGALVTPVKPHFSLAPFFGTLLAIPLLGESVTNRLLIAGALMLVGVWLHLTERHGHAHTHEFMAHTRMITNTMNIICISICQTLKPRSGMRTGISILC